MKKMFIAALLSLGFLGSFNASFADATAAPACGYTSDEASFAGQLSDANQMVFCGMTSSDRASCMSMVGTPDENGSPMTADAAVLKMSGS